MATRRRIRISITEEDLSDVLGYWSKGESIPVEITVVGKGKHTEDGTLGPGGFLRADLREVTGRWLSEEGLDSSRAGRDLKVSAEGLPPLGLHFEGRRSVTIECRVEFDSEQLSWFRRLEKEELKAFIEDLSMILSLKPHEFRVLWRGDIPAGVEISAKVFADGLTKDRLMSVVYDVGRSAVLVLDIVRGRSGRSAFQGPVGSRSRD